MMKVNRMTLAALSSTLLLVPPATAAGADGAARPLVIAHRGASGYLPEHTLPAKALAFAMGADYLEQDLALSRDGVPVVLHDVQIDTVTDVARRFPDRAREDGRFYAIDFTWAELKQMSATERMNLKTGQAVFTNRFPAGQSAFALVSLEEELQFIRGLERSTGRKVGIYPELKQPEWHRKQGRDLSAVVLPILAKYGYRTKADRCFVQCFELKELKRIRTELGWQGSLVYLCGKAPPQAELEEAAKIVDGLGPALGAVVAAPANGAPQVTDLVRRAHELKLVVHPYTARVDELPRWAGSYEELLDFVLVRAGADGLFTDFPDRAAEFVRGRSWTK